MEDTVPFDPTRETVVVYKDDWLAANHEINVLRDAIQRRREADKEASEVVRLCNDLQSSIYPAIMSMLGAAKSLYEATQRDHDRMIDAIYEMKPKRRQRKQAAPDA